jgi:hypothetical protein
VAVGRNSLRCRLGLIDLIEAKAASRSIKRNPAPAFVIIADNWRDVSPAAAPAPYSRTT